MRTSSDLSLIQFDKDELLQLFNDKDFNSLRTNIEIFIWKYLLLKKGYTETQLDSSNIVNRMTDEVMKRMKTFDSSKSNILTYVTNMTRFAYSHYYSNKINKHHSSEIEAEKIDFNDIEYNYLYNIKYDAVITAS
jgi:hypothetical protein